MKKHGEEVENQIKRLDKALRYKEQIEGLTKKLSQGLDRMGFTERRELLRLLVDNIIYDNGNVTIKTVIPFDERQLPTVLGGLR